MVDGVSDARLANIIPVTRKHKSPYLRGPVIKRCHNAAAVVVIEWKSEPHVALCTASQASATEREQYDDTARTR